MRGAASSRRNSRPLGFKLLMKKTADHGERTEKELAGQQTPLKVLLYSELQVCTWKGRFLVMWWRKNLKRNDAKTGGELVSKRSKPKRDNSKRKPTNRMASTAPQKIVHWFKQRLVDNTRRTQRHPSYEGKWRRIVRGLQVGRIAARGLDKGSPGEKKTQT